MANVFFASCNFVHKRNHLLMISCLWFVWYYISTSLIFQNIFQNHSSSKLNRIPEDEFKKASKTNHWLKTRLNKFKEQMDSVNNSEDEWVAIRPEWTTVDRVLASRFYHFVFIL